MTDDPRRAAQEALIDQWRDFQAALATQLDAFRAALDQRTAAEEALIQEWRKKARESGNRYLALAYDDCADALAALLK